MPPYCPPALALRTAACTTAPDFRYWPSRLLLAQSLLLPKGGPANGMGGPAADLPPFLPGAVPLSQTAYASCPLCGVATSGRLGHGACMR